VCTRSSDWLVRMLGLLTYMRRLTTCQGAQNNNLGYRLTAVACIATNTCRTPGQRDRSSRAAARRTPPRLPSACSTSLNVHVGSRPSRPLKTHSESRLCHLHYLANWSRRVRALTVALETALLLPLPLLLGARSRGRARRAAWRRRRRRLDASVLLVRLSAADSPAAAGTGELSSRVAGSPGALAGAAAAAGAGMGSAALATALAGSSAA